MKRNLKIYMQQHSQSPLDLTMTAEHDKHWPIAQDKPYFHYILGKSHVSKPYHLVLPTKMHDVLPKALVHVILTCENKKWEMNYYGDRNHQRFDIGWKDFVIDNNLKAGDGCVFQLTECNTDVLKFRVQILNGEIPSEFLNRVDGKSSNTPIIIE